MSRTTGETPGPETDPATSAPAAVRETATGPAAPAAVPKTATGPAAPAAVPKTAMGTSAPAAVPKTGAGPAGLAIVSPAPGPLDRPGLPSPEPAPPTSRLLARAALLTACLSGVAALLGLVRDQSLARLFGAGRDTDAFLVAWTVPEFAATLLIEDGLAFALIPAFSAALARRARGAAGDPVRSLVAGTLPRLALAFAAGGALLALAAPWCVAVLAPGLPDPDLAVDCTRLTASCVLSFGLAGYCSAALRAHRRFLAPAAIYIVHNVAIIAAMYALGGRWGVRSAAVGVAAGGLLMVALQVPSLAAQLRGNGTDPRPAAPAPPLDVPLLASVLLFALCRQSQVLIERFLASGLPAGAISHLNYAQKVAQIPMTLSMMLSTVTFPVVARALADGDTERARGRVERDVSVAARLVLLGTAVVVACAPQLIGLLFQRGAFTARDTAATAGVMRVYALGLLAQTLTGVLVRSYFSAGRATWYPVAAMTAGIAATWGIGVCTAGSRGAVGIAAANAAGITLTAALLLAGTGRRGVPLRAGAVLRGLGRPVGAAAGAAVAGGLVAASAGPAGLAAGAATVTAVFLLLGGAPGVRALAPALRPVRSLPQRLAHALTR
ncbi:lipid II flippase MurJ [Streptomyces sp. NPDC049590]|uniref:lipid II flippase MurJ n=1 Tax=Streptomyces sp. NPDC049590 TaxID=3154834 RepID=UPI00342358B4